MGSYLAGADLMIVEEPQLVSNRVLKGCKPGILILRWRFMSSVLLPFIFELVDSWSGSGDPGPSSENGRS